MRKLILLTALLLPSLALAQQWEYRVINLPSTIDTSVTPMKMKEGALELQPGDYYIDTQASAVLTKLSAEGWEVVTMTSAASMGGWGHFALLRRPIQ